MSVFISSNPRYRIAALREAFSGLQAGRLAILAAISSGGYLLASALTLRLGFPLDDAWIHQTYARNLALQGEWAFIPGMPSAGSTAPLWSFLLAGGHFLRLGPYLWAYLLGWLCLWGIGLAGAALFRRWAPARTAWAPWVGAFLILEWHLAWAAGSGMETLLFALLILLGLLLISADRVRGLELGLLIGLAAWVRPDGITLLGPAGLVLFLARERRRGLAELVWLAAGAAIIFGPYLLFNRLIAGAWWPNTFFAKQAEYSVHREMPFLARYAAQAALPLIGAGALLVPGFIGSVWEAVRRRSWPVLGGAAWLLGYLGLYAWRLPVTYQHGRYVIPAMPVFFVLGIVGVAGLARPAAPGLVMRVLSRGWLAATALLLGVFWLQGAGAYARDVAVIETEMRAAAQWVQANTPAEALIAVHDIGALGYFGERRILDLAGLVSPEVIPILRDEPALETYLTQAGVDYLVTFPGWYPSLSQEGELIYTTGGEYSPALGGENMAVYRWP